MLWLVKRMYLFIWKEPFSLRTLLGLEKLVVTESRRQKVGDIKKTEIADEVMVTLDGKWNTFLSQNEKQKFFDPIQVIFSRIEAQERKFLHIFLESVSSFFERMNCFLLGTRAACFIIMMIVMALLILAFAIEGPTPYYSSTSLPLNTRPSSVSHSIKSHDSNSQFVNDAWRGGGGG